MLFSSEMRFFEILETVSLCKSNDSWAKYEASTSCMKLYYWNVWWDLDPFTTIFYFFVWYWFLFSHVHIARPNCFLSPGFICIPIKSNTCFILFYLAIIFNKPSLKRINVISNERTSFHISRNYNFKEPKILVPLKLSTNVTF